MILVWDSFQGWRVTSPSYNLLSDLHIHLNFLIPFTLIDLHDDPFLTRTFAERNKKKTMSSLNLRFIRKFLCATPRPRAMASTAPSWLSRPYSSKGQVKPLTPSRPDLQPQARRKHLQDMQIDMYPRIQNNGVVQTFNEFKGKFSAMQTGVIDDKQLVTIRGVCHCTRCCSPATPTQAESTRSILYCRCSPPAEKEMQRNFFVYENPIYFCAIESLLITFSHRSKAE